MALPQDDLIMTSTAAAGNFHQHFRQSIATLQERVDSLLLPETPTVDRQASIDMIMVGIARLSTELADASGELPSYDQRSYNQAVKALNDKLAIARASLAPKTKFSFKNKRLAAPTSEANSVNTSRSVTPTYLRDPGNTSRGVPTPALASPSVHAFAGQDANQNDETSKLTNDDNQWILLSGRKDAYVSWPPSNVVDNNSSPPLYGQTCVVSEMSTSIIKIESNDKSAAPSALTLNTTDGTLILAPDIQGAAHITGLRNSVLVLSCHQFRMHKSHNVDVYLYCNNRPIIEDCSHIRFARMPSTLMNTSLGMESGTEKTVRKQNMFDQVDDFKWLRAEASPNWRSMREDEAVTEQAWQEILERLRKVDGGAEEGLASESIADILGGLNVRTA